MAKTVAIIGAGQIGFAACFAFLHDGWDVSLFSRTEPQWGGRWEHYNRFQHYTRGEGPAPEADLVLDTIAYDAEDVDRYQPDDVGRLILISSASVYCDDQGRTLDEAAQNGFPEFSCPITEDQPTVAAGRKTYSTRKVRMENRAEELFGERATILRPGAVHGEKSRHPREWWFVKRILDGRTRIPFANRGLSRFQTTSAHTIGYVAQALADEEVGGIFNVKDQDSPSLIEIGKAMEYHLEQDLDLILIDGYPESGIGRSPWSVPRPFVTSSAKLKRHGISAGRPYEDDVANTIGELVRNTPTDWRAAFPQLAAYPWDLFDYEAEDRFFASQ